MPLSLLCLFRYVLRTRGTKNAQTSRDGESLQGGGGKWEREEGLVKEATQLQNTRLSLARASSLSLSLSRSLSLARARALSLLPSPSLSRCVSYTNTHIRALSYTHTQRRCYPDTTSQVSRERVRGGQGKGPAENRECLRHPAPNEDMAGVFYLISRSLCLINRSLYFDS